MACSRDCDLEHLAWWAARKGIALIGTGDLCHPAWSAEIRDKLVPAEPGLFRLRPDLERDVLADAAGVGADAGALPCSRWRSPRSTSGARRPARCTTCCTRRTSSVAAELTRAAGPDRQHRLRRPADPRAGLRATCWRSLLDSGEGGYLVPAHVWTPWFAALGSKSGFDSVADCYADLADHIFAVETGLSSDPAMNWRVSALDRYRLVSNSDAHSPPALGREATVFDTELYYAAVREALETGDGLAGTVEFFPEEGKYHLDGHRSCEVRLEPAETRGAGRPVPGLRQAAHRRRAAPGGGAGRPAAGVPAGGRAAGFRFVQLPEVVGEILGVGPRVEDGRGRGGRLVARLGPELVMLQDVPLEDVGRGRVAAAGRGDRPAAAR